MVISREERDPGMSMLLPPTSGNMIQLSLKVPVFFLKDSVLVVELRCGLQAGTVEI